jgi:hypothetical protein
MIQKDVIKNVRHFLRFISQVQYDKKSYNDGYDSLTASLVIGIDYFCDSHPNF